MKVEEWRVKRWDTEEWMRYRQLPPELQEHVCRFVQYIWLASRGVDEESVFTYRFTPRDPTQSLSLPTDLCWEIQRHFCLALVWREHTSTIFSQDLIVFHFIKSQCFPKYMFCSSLKWMTNFLALYADALSHF